MTEFSKDELVPPTWLDQSFFERALRSYEHDQSIEVKSFEITPGSKPEEHFASAMFKVNVTYSSKKYRVDNKNIKLILKTMPKEDGLKKVFLSESPAFKNEARMYSKVLPEMERILESVGETTKIAPNLVYQNLDTEILPVIVVVDLNFEGYQTFDGLGITNIEVMNVIIRRLAKFHATSMHLQQNGEHLEEFDSHFFKAELEKTNGPSKNLWKRGFTFLVTQLKTWGPEYEIFSEKLTGKIDELFDKVLKVYQRDSTFKVLCHGDFHSKNMLYRNGSLKDEDLLLIDFQFPFWTSPAIDLFYVFNIVAHSDLTDIHRNEFVLTYYLEFSSTLRKIGYREKIPTLLDLHIEILKCSHLELFQAISFISPRFMDYSKVDVDEIMKNPNAMEEMALVIYGNPLFRSYMKNLFTRHLHIGSLD